MTHPINKKNNDYTLSSPEHKEALQGAGSAACQQTINRILVKSSHKENHPENAAHE